jgi:hypothetical protein
MSIRLDPRHLGTLRALASEAGVRPGELVTIWVTERLDAERSGAPSPTAVGPVLESLNDRIQALSRRLDQLEGGSSAPVDAPSAEPAAPPRRRGRPPKGASGNGAGSADAPAADTPAPKRARAAAARPKKMRGKNPAVPLHEEIAAVLAERGPLSAAELATAVTERGIYAPPRSSKPLDATAVSVRVSNPRYRARFTRAEGKIGLA